MTRAPWRAASLAVAAPIPLEAPVISFCARSALNSSTLNKVVNNLLKSNLLERCYCDGIQGGRFRTRSRVFSSQVSSDS